MCVNKDVNLFAFDNAGCLNMHRTHVTANNSTTNNVFFSATDLKMVYCNNYESLITMH